MSQSLSTLYSQRPSTEVNFEFSFLNSNDAISNISPEESPTEFDYLNEKLRNNQYSPNKSSFGNALQSDTNKAMLIVNSIECNFDMPIESKVKDFIYQSLLKYKKHPNLQQEYSNFYDAIKFIFELHLSDNKTFEMLRFIFSNIEIKAKSEEISDFDDHFKPIEIVLDGNYYENEIDDITERLKQYLIVQTDIEKGFSLKEIIYDIINCIEQSKEIQTQRFGISSHDFFSLCMFDPIFDDDEIYSIKSNDLSNFVRVLITILKNSTQCSVNFDEKI